MHRARSTHIAHTPKAEERKPPGAAIGPTETDQLVWQLVDRLMLVWHGDGVPPENIWGRVMEVIDAHRHALLRVIVFENGGGPSAGQQLRLTQAISARSLPLPVAVVSDSTRVRFLASTLALFTKRIRTFRLSEAEQAFAFLELSESELRAARAFAAGKRAMSGLFADDR